MNKTIKALTLGLAGAAAALAFNVAAPTKAEAGTCWFRMGQYHSAPAEWCGTQRRINANGHVVFDVVDNQGHKVTIVMWDDNTAEIIGLLDYVVTVPMYTDRDGDTRFVFDGGKEFIVRF